MNKSPLMGAMYALSLVFVTPHAAALSVMDYMVITEFVGTGSDAFIMSNSEIGAIGTKSNPDTTATLPPSGGSGTELSVSDGITLDGDAAITNGGKVNFSNSDVHAVNTGPATPGSQGVDCDATYSICTISGGNISSGNQFNTTDPASFTTLAENNGIQGGFDLSGITDELVLLRGLIGALPSSGSRTPTDGKIDSVANEVWDYTVGAYTGAGLHVIDIITSGKFSIIESNLTIKGDAEDTIIFRFSSLDQAMEVSESNLLLDGGIGINNVLWYVDAKQGVQSFNFSDATFYGMSLWDIGADPDNYITLSNVEFCGQVISDRVDFSNTSGSACTFDTSAVPVPAAVWLFGSGLLGLVGMARRKKA